MLLSQEDFAKETNVSVATINRWENAKTKPNITAMRHIREFCLKNGLDFGYLESEWLESGGRNE